MQVVTAATFEQEVKQSTIPVIVDFTAPWCGPCLMLKPHLDELDQTASGRYKVVVVDVDNDPELATEYYIASIPAVLVFKDGKDNHERFIGMACKDTEKLFKVMGIDR